MSKRLGLVGGLGLSIVGALALLSFDATVTPRKAEAAVGVCNGTTDDTAAINAALALSSGIVELSPGNCRITAPLVFPNTFSGQSGTGLKGQGMFGTTILPDSPWAGGSDIITMNGGGEIRDLNINARGQNVWCVQQHPTATQQNFSAHVWRVGFFGCGTTSGAGFMQNSIGNYEIRDSFFQSSAWGVYNADGGVGSIIDGNVIQGLLGGIYLDGPTNHDEGHLIINNKIQAPANGVQINDGLEIHINGNHIGPIGDNASAIIANGKPNGPIRMLDNWLEGVIARQGCQNEVGSNYFPHTDSLQLFPLASSPFGVCDQDWNVHDNTFDSGSPTSPAQAWGIQLSNMNRVILHHNFLNNEGVNPTGGIYSAGTASHILVEGNRTNGPCTKSGSATEVYVLNLPFNATCANAATYPTTW